MYAIRQKDTLRFYYGMDYKYSPPRVKTSARAKLIRYYNSLEEAQNAQKRLGDDYEIVILHYEPMGVRRAKDNGRAYYLNYGSRK